MNRSRFSFLPLAIAVLAVLPGSACHSRSDSESSIRPDQVHLLGVKFGLPTDAKEVKIYEEGDRDKYQAMRFDSSLQNARAFAAKLTGNAPRKGAWSFNSDFNESWGPSEDVLSRVEGSTTKTPAGNRIAIMIHRLPNNQARVWLEIFETDFGPEAAQGGMG